MNYIDALNWYLSFGKFGINPGLERIKSLCRQLQNPQNSLKFIHISGTNGKGSVCEELANILSCAGYKTGLYTSPEVIDFRERMQIDGEMISEAELIKLTEIIKPVVEELNENSVFPTQFEVITAAAFLWFAKEKCDFVVLETGLGGRFDATNIIETPIVCAITSVSLDHTAVLGDTYQKIAFEKSGIIKNGTTVVCPFSERDDVKLTVLDAAEKNNADVVFSAPENEFTVVDADISGTTVNYGDVKIRIPFCGEHQLKNAAIVVNICKILTKKGIFLTENDIKNGIEMSSLPARTEIISSSPLVILDGCHNDASTFAFSEIIKKYLGGKKILAVMGMMADKDCKKSAGNVVKYFSSVISVQPSNKRSMNVNDFSEIVRSLGVDCINSLSPYNAVDLAVEKLAEYDALIVCGSLYLAGDIRDYLIEKISYYDKFEQQE